MSAVQPIDLDDYLHLSVGGLSDDFRDRTGKKKSGEVVSLVHMAENIEFLKRVSGGDEIRWLMLTTATVTLPYDYSWRAFKVIGEVDNISMGQKLVNIARVEQTNFEGPVDYVLINLLKTRQMCVAVCFANEADAVLHKLRD